jgi:phospholipase C
MDRRDFIKMLGLAGTSAAAYAACSNYMSEALAQSTAIDDLLSAAAHCKPGSLKDIEHVVILMQENRSFDHYFGTLRGVRGFGDPRPLRLLSGNPVWEQSDGARPYRLPKKTAKESGIAGETIPADSAGNVFLQDPSHGFPDGLAAWNHGRMDKWRENKGYVALAHYTEQDIPLYFKLAKAFTLCDAYFCSHNGATCPNRSFLFTGTCMGKTDNKFFSGEFKGTADWKSYPERLEDVGVDWKFYQDGLTWTGDPFAGNFGNNTLEYFKQFRDRTTAIYKKNQSVNSVLRTDAGKPSQFEQDIIDGNLPEVSWINAPEAFTEHPTYPPHFGEYYINEILRAFAANEKVWHKTLFLINFDENGGFFDHVLPPAPPPDTGPGVVSAGITLTAAGTINSETSIESVNPVGMGTRVPMLVISPFSTGGRVNSEVFDHTSVNRFLDKWLIARGKLPKGTQPFQVSSWRQAISGDLTSTLDFNRLSTEALDKLAAPGTKATILTQADRQSARAANKSPFKPGLADVRADGGKPILVKQDKTRCEILPLGYDFQVYLKYAVHPATGAKRVDWTIRNAGPLGASFYVIPYSRTDKPWRYSVEGVKPGGKPIEVTDHAQVIKGKTPGDYAHVIHGPNGYQFEFAGNTLDDLQMQLPDIIAVGSAEDGKKLKVVLGRWASASSRLKVIDAYTGAEQAIDKSGEDKDRGTTTIEIATVDGWYDVAFVDGVNGNNFLRRYAGHLENGKISKSDPAIGMTYDAKKRVYVSLST